MLYPTRVRAPDDNWSISANFVALAVLIQILVAKLPLRPGLDDRLRRLYFALLYARARDPWGYEGNAYEDAKYHNTLDALGQRRFRRTLEVGCSVGVFSMMLVDRTEELLAIDVSSAAVKRARRRLGTREGVKVEQAALPEWSPPGKFDLIVCSEVLYYLRRDAMLASFRRLESSLAPNGSLIAVHRRGKGRSSPLSGDEVHDLLIKHATAKHVHSETHARYRLDRFDAVSVPEPAQDERGEARREDHQPTISSGASK